MSVEEKALREWSSLVSDLREHLGSKGRPLGRDRFAQLLGVKSGRTVLRWELGDSSPGGERRLHAPNEIQRERLLALAGYVLLSHSDYEPDPRILREVLSRFADVLKERERASHVFRDVDDIGPPWLRKMLELALSDNWEGVHALSDLFHGSLDELSADEKCLFYLRSGAAAIKCGYPRDLLQYSEDGLRVVDQCTKDDPVPPKRARGLRTHKGVALLRLGDLDKAEQEFQRVCSEFGPTRPALMNLLIVSSLRERLDECVERAEELVSRFPDANVHGSEFGQALVDDDDLHWWRSQSAFRAVFPELVLPERGV